MPSSSSLDSTALAVDTLNPAWPICAGYLDNVLSTFKNHGHPFVLVSTLAMNWSGATPMPREEVDVLKFRDDQVPDYSPIKDIWLKACIEDPQFEYLRLWPENLYKLSVDCDKLEIPDVLTLDAVLLEEEYYQDPFERFGPPRLSKRRISLLPMLQIRANLTQQDVPIFVPTIEEHLNAFLDQSREQIETGVENGGAPEWQIRNSIRYLYLDWDWEHNQEWLMRLKIRERNRNLMTKRLIKWRRKPLILYGNVRWQFFYGKRFFYHRHFSIQ